MKAIVRDRYGSPDVLRLSDVEVPDVGDEQVLVRVRAAGLDRGAWHIMAGLPYLIRAAGYGLRTPKVAGLGSELAGVVEAVGAKVTGLEAGEAVFGTCRASFAEYASTEPDKLARMPANLSFEQAAAVPISAVTALQALRDHGRVKAGQHVLVIGASGGVGTFAVQIAKTLGAHVTAMASTQKLDLVRSLDGRHPPPARRHGAVALRAPASGDIHRQAEPLRPRHATGAHRGRVGHSRRRPGHRVGPGPRRDPRPHARTRARQDHRHHMTANGGGPARRTAVRRQPREQGILVLGTAGRGTVAREPASR